MASPAQASTSATTVESVTTAATAPAHEHIENGTSLQERPRKRQRSQEPQAEDDSSSFPHTADDQSSPRPFELSYFGIAPHDEFTREIGQRIWSLAKDGKYVEIEAKIGLLLDANTRRKLNFPVATECILTSEGMVRFESDMSRRQHAHLNQLFNDRYSAHLSRDYRGAPISYRHTRETDYTHQSQDRDRNSKVRVTKVHPDKHNRRIEVLKDPPHGMVCKRRLGNMNIYSPKQMFDYRISVNTETPLNAFPTTPVENARYKDRVSYEHQFLQIDLTQVEMHGAVSHELEVEIKDMDLLMAEGAKEFSGIQPNRYYEMIQVFLNTVRMIIKNSGPP